MTKFINDEIRRNQDRQVRLMGFNHKRVYRADVGIQFRMTAHIV